MAEGLGIRAATPADLPSLLALYQHLIPENPPDLHEAEAILARLHLYPGSRILLGHLDNEIIASCVLVVIPNLTRGGQSYALIENVVTHPSHRRRGHGQRLLDAAVEAAWQSGCYKVMLLTSATRAGTLDFYRAAGFDQTKTAFQKRRIPARTE